MYQKYKNVETVKPGGLDLKDRLVGIQRVTKVTKGGRAFGFSAIVVVGDENGVVGSGLGKSKEVATAIAKAIEDAITNRTCQSTLRRASLARMQRVITIKPAARNAALSMDNQPNATLSTIPNSISEARRRCS